MAHLTKPDYQKIHGIQLKLEESYGAHTGLNVCDFLVEVPNFAKRGELLIEQNKEDINIALLLDRDILMAAKESTAKERTFSVVAEEVSHFVYLSFNHQKGRNVTKLEMEVQSEIDRIFLAFQGDNLCESEDEKRALLQDLFYKPYQQEAYEEARLLARSFIRNLSGGDPRAWTSLDLQKIQKFFHCDLAEKIHLSRRT